MIRFTGVYRIDQGTLEDLDQMVDDAMTALMTDDTVLSPDVIVSMEDRTFAIEFLIRTDDAWAAGEIGGPAINRALMAAGVRPPDKARMAVHRDLLRTAPTTVRAELVDA